MLSSRRNKPHSDEPECRRITIHQSNEGVHWEGFPIQRYRGNVVRVSISSFLHPRCSPSHLLRASAWCFAVGGQYIVTGKRGKVTSRVSLLTTNDGGTLTRISLLGRKEMITSTPSGPRTDCSPPSIFCAFREFQEQTHRHCLYPFAVVTKLEENTTKKARETE
mgnify:FL=1